MASNYREVARKDLEEGKPSTSTTSSSDLEFPLNKLADDIAACNIATTSLLALQQRTLAAKSSSSTSPQRKWNITDYAGRPIYRKSGSHNLKEDDHGCLRESETTDTEKDAQDVSLSIQLPEIYNVDYSKYESRLQRKYGIVNDITRKYFSADDDFETGPMRYEKYDRCRPIDFKVIFPEVIRDAARCQSPTSSYFGPNTVVGERPQWSVYNKTSSQTGEFDPEDRDRPGSNEESQSTSLFSYDFKFGGREDKIKSSMAKPIRDSSPPKCDVENEEAAEYTSGSSESPGKDGTSPRRQTYAETVLESAYQKWFDSEFPAFPSFSGNEVLAAAAAETGPGGSMTAGACRDDHDPANYYSSRLSSADDPESSFREAAELPGRRNKKQTRSGRVEKTAEKFPPRNPSSPVSSGSDAAACCSHSDQPKKKTGGKEKMLGSGDFLREFDEIFPPKQEKDTPTYVHPSIAKMSLEEVNYLLDVDIDLPYNPKKNPDDIPLPYNSRRSKARNLNLKKKLKESTSACASYKRK